MGLDLAIRSALPQRQLRARRRPGPRARFGPMTLAFPLFETAHPMRGSGGWLETARPRSAALSERSAMRMSPRRRPGSTRKQECRAEADAPAVRTSLGPFGPVADAGEQADRLIPDPHQFRRDRVDRNRPLLGIPVIGGFGLQSEGPGILGGVRGEGLQERPVDVGACVLACEGPRTTARS